ncbi:MAG: outer membrane beta-barrel protein [Muribaculaceae bacterium]|nr:outer membrane beta-barrel protein [Muribaculaceae bacterium]
MLHKSAIIASLAALLISLSANAQENIKPRKSLGVTAGYVTTNQSASAGLQFSYAFSSHFVLAPSIDYVFRHHNRDAILFNIDYHGPWQLDASGKWYVYHILGINYGSWNRHIPNHSSTAPTARGEGGPDDVTTRRNHIGFDFGLGFAYNVTPTMRITCQGKFNWIRHDNTGLFNMGISYVF